MNEAEINVLLGVLFGAFLGVMMTVGCIVLARSMPPPQNKPEEIERATFTERDMEMLRRQMPGVYEAARMAREYEKKQRH